MTKTQWKLVFIVGVVVLVGFFIYPTYEWYTMPQAERERLETTKDPIVGLSLIHISEPTRPY